MTLSAFSVLVGCESRADKLPTPPISHAIDPDTSTSLGRVMKKEEEKHKGESGFHIISTGSEGFRMRLALIRAAEKTLDLQYYGIHNDATSNLMLEAVVRAAQRGVRIRFLLDNNTYAQVAKTLSILDEFKNLEVRIFNPFYTPSQSVATKLVNTLTDLDNVERRMHNKALISDNQMAILGGRNLGDEYFEENADMAFKDIDILAAGPIVPLISASFDNYWNSPNTLPVDRLKSRKADPQTIAKIREQLHDHWEETAATPVGKQLLTSKIADELKTDTYKLYWCPAELAVDDPSKIDHAATDTISRPFNKLKAMVGKAQNEFIIISPYFVPRDEGMTWLKELTDRGVKIRVLTNSLASTDVVAVHTGYRPYREQLLANGIDLYEMKPIDGKRPKQRLMGKKVPAQASLHAKVYIIDRKDIMIGSFNLDPRSIELNTEITIAIHSPELAAQVVKMFNEVIEPETSYHVQASANTKALIWNTVTDDQQITYTQEPDAGIWRRIQENILSLLPLEDHL